MSEENKGAERVTFSRGYDVCIMAIDGTWRRDCASQRHLGHRRRADGGRLDPGPQSEGILPAAVIHRAGLSALRTGAGQRHRDGRVFHQGQERQEAATAMRRGEGRHDGADRRRPAADPAQRLRQPTASRSERRFGARMPAAPQAGARRRRRIRRGHGLLQQMQGKAKACIACPQRRLAFA